MKLRVLDLFSGTQSVKKALDQRWPHWEYTSLDLANADICTDINMSLWIGIIKMHIHTRGNRWHSRQNTGLRADGTNTFIS